MVDNYCALSIFSSEQSIGMYLCVCDIRSTGHGPSFSAATNNIYRWSREIFATEGDYSEA